MLALRLLGLALPEHRTGTLSLSIPLVAPVPALTSIRTEKPVTSVIFSMLSFCLSYQQVRRLCLMMASKRWSLDY